MSLLDFIFPKNCLGCQMSGIYICQDCLEKVQTSGFRDRNTYSIWRYQGVLRKAILRLKYNFNFDIASCLADYASSELRGRKINFGRVVLVPIPLHMKRQKWRGFNQSEILGEKIAKNMGWCFEKDLLIRKIYTTPQARLDKSKRRENVKGIFVLNPNAKVKNKNYIIFDDVLTTGATMNEAQKIIIRAGAKRVYGLTIAST